MTNRRIGISKNLETGGTYDLLLVKSSDVYPEGKISFSFYDVPMKITGLQKVAQIFLKVLLTTKGSDPFYPERGTLFPTLVIGANALTNDGTLLSDIRDAVNDAQLQVVSYLNINTSDPSSCLDNVQILGLDRISDGVVMYLSLMTLAGERAAVAVPFPEFGLTQ